MKAALIFDSLIAKGGGQRQVLQLANHLQKQGWEVSIFTTLLDKKQCYPDLCNKVKIRYLFDINEVKLAQPAGFFKRQITSLINFLKLSLMIYRYHPDILNPHDWPASQPAWLVKLLTKGKVKIIWMCNDLWHQYNPYYKKKLTERFISWPMNLIDKLTIKHFADKIIVLDKRIKKLVKKFYKREAMVVRSGLDIKKFTLFKISKNKTKQIKCRLGLGNKDFFCLSVASFFPQRRFEDAILAVKKIIEKNKNLNFQYIIIGSNKADLAYFQLVCSLIKKHNLEKKIKLITKPISDNELLEYYSACDIFIFPNDKQTWGLAVIEAMALGKPSIVSQGAGVHEVLTNKKTAILVKPRSPDDLADKLIELMNSQELRKKISQTGKKFVLSNFSWQKYTMKMIKQFKLVLNND